MARGGPTVADTRARNRPRRRQRRVDRELLRAFVFDGRCRAGRCRSCRQVAKRPWRWRRPAPPVNEHAPAHAAAFRALRLTVASPIRKPAGARCDPAGALRLRRRGVAHGPRPAESTAATADTAPAPHRPMRSVRIRPLARSTAVAVALPQIVADIAGRQRSQGGEVEGAAPVAGGPAPGRRPARSGHRADQADGLRPGRQRHPGPAHRADRGGPRHRLRARRGTTTTSSTIGCAQSSRASRKSTSGSRHSSAW